METEELTFDNFRAALEEYGQHAEAYYREALASNGKNASAALSRSIAYHVNQNGSTFEVSLDLLDYWKYIEYGRKPGKWPPVSAILSWIRIKPVLPRPYNGKLPSEKSLAFLIARKIGQKGIKAQPLLRESVRRTDDEMMEKLTRALSEDLSKSIVLLLAESYGNSL